MDFTKTKKSGGNGSGKNGRVEDGTFPVRVVQVVDLGIQKGEFKGEEYIRPEVMITFEFPTETITIDGEEKPRWLSKQFTVSMHEKSALYALVNAFDPDGKATRKGSNPKGLLGLPGMVTVGSTASGNAKVAGVSRLMKGLAVAELQNGPVYFELDSASSENNQAFEALPSWLQDKIKSAMNFDTSKFAKGSVTEYTPNPDQANDDNPF